MKHVVPNLQGAMRRMEMFQELSTALLSQSCDSLWGGNSNEPGGVNIRLNRTLNRTRLTSPCGAWPAPARPRQRPPPPSLVSHRRLLHCRLLHCRRRHEGWRVAPPAAPLPPSLVSHRRLLHCRRRHEGWRVAPPAGPLPAAPAAAAPAEAAATVVATQGATAPRAQAAGAAAAAGPAAGPAAAVADTTADTAAEAAAAVGPPEPPAAAAAAAGAGAEAASPLSQQQLLPEPPPAAHAAARQCRPPRQAYHAPRTARSGQRPPRRLCIGNNRKYYYCYCHPVLPIYYQRTSTWRLLLRRHRGDSEVEEAEGVEEADVGALILVPHSAAHAVDVHEEAGAPAHAGVLARPHRGRPEVDSARLWAALARGQVVDLDAVRQCAAGQHRVGRLLRRHAHDARVLDERLHRRAGARGSLEQLQHLGEVVREALEGEGQPVGAAADHEADDHGSRRAGGRGARELAQLALGGLGARDELRDELLELLVDALLGLRVEVRVSRQIEPLAHHQVGGLAQRGVDERLVAREEKGARARAERLELRDDVRG
eukprot:scaffold16916_cov49-Phaeocystis_antarctica.AAC.3